MAAVGMHEPLPAVPPPSHLHHPTTVVFVFGDVTKDVFTQPAIPVLPASVQNVAVADTHLAPSHLQSINAAAAQPDSAVRAAAAALINVQMLPPLVGGGLPPVGGEVMLPQVTHLAPTHLQPILAAPVQPDSPVRAGIATPALAQELERL